MCYFAAANELPQMNRQLIDTVRQVPHALSTDRVEHRHRCPARCPLPENRRRLLHVSKMFRNFANGTEFRTYCIEALCSFLLIENLRTSSTVTQEEKHSDFRAIGVDCVDLSPFCVQASQGRQSAKRGIKAAHASFVTHRRPRAARGNKTENSTKKKIAQSTLSMPRAPAPAIGVAKFQFADKDPLTCAPKRHTRALPLHRELF